MREGLVVVLRWCGVWEGVEGSSSGCCGVDGEVLFGFLVLTVLDTNRWDIVCASVVFLSWCYNFSSLDLHLSGGVQDLREGNYAPSWLVIFLELSCICSDWCQSNDELSFA